MTSLLLILSVAQAAPPPQWTLPDDVTPRHHTLELTVDPRQTKLTGTSTIEIELKAQRDIVWLNGRDITVQRASIDGRKAAARLAGNEFIGLSTGKSLGPGVHTLRVSFTARLSTTAKSGPYRRLVDGDWYAYTVFTPIDARRAFPCFDEPRFKTPWTISIRVPAGDRAVSNGPEIATEAESGGMKRIRFAPTQKIPSEVVAFAVGPFDIYDGGRAGERGTPVRVITPRGRAAEGKIAADATRRVLPKLEEYTGIAYPWDKLDHLALPDGAFGAVENPGLITYVSKGLLLPADATPERIQALERLEAHELAHQWFGNLVTQSTWDDVWLSEGFATWLSQDLLDPGHLKFEASRARIIAADDGPKSHPVRQPKRNRAEIDSVYDQFPYQKGGATLLTLEGWLGPEKLRDGLRSYLKKYAYGNASTAELAAELGDDVSLVLDSMLNRKGVPVVEGKIDCARGVATVTQPAAAFQPIPVCYRTADGQGCVVMKSAVTEFALNGCPGWILWNAGGMGYFRTRWGVSLPPLEALTAAERLTLALDLKWAGSVEALKALQQDPDPDVAAAAKAQP